MNDGRPCNCGSGKTSWWETDARGIEIARVCPSCVDGVLARYRPEVLSDGGYDVDETVEPDGEW